MNLQHLQTKLIEVARKNTPGDHVPFAFEKRIMGRLAKPMLDAWSLWGRALWRAAAACVLAVALISGWSMQIEPATESADLTQHFEETVLAALDDQPAIAFGEETW